MIGGGKRFEVYGVKTQTANIFERHFHKVLSYLSLMSLVYINFFVDVPEG